MLKIICLSVCFLYSFPSYALDANELSSSLTFKDTINFANKKFHHTFLFAQSGIDKAQAAALLSDSKNDLTINLKGYLRKVGVSDVAINDQDNDSKVSLLAQKILYDFGLSSSKKRYASLFIETQILKYEVEKERYLNSVIVAYFNVLKADNNFLINNEAMSIAFVSLKDKQDKVEFGLSSDLDILKAQSNYQSFLQKRFLSEAEQRFTRQYLAELLGASNVPDSLEIFEFSRQKKIIDDVDIIVALAMSNSKWIKLRKAEMKAAKQQLMVASQSQSGQIAAELEVSDYQRESTFRDDWRASINFNFPLYSGNKEQAAMLSAQAKLASKFARLKETQSLVRMRVLELWQSISQKSLELEGAIIQQEYRDLYLEQSRADYELEYKSDLGDAMVEFTRSRAQRYDAEFTLETAWRELMTLVGSNNLGLLYEK